MESNQHSVVHAICRRMLRPVASMLLRCGMTWKEFSDLSKSVFVQVATGEFGIKGRPTNVSRVSILTGIGRKEVKRQRDLLDGGQPGVKGKTTDATRVLSGWYQDPEFQDESGAPLELDEVGANPSFEVLCGRYGGDIAMQTMLKELVKTNAVERREDGKLRVQSRYYQPSVSDHENLVFAADRIHDVAATMNNNVFPGESSAPRFGGFAGNDDIPITAIPKFAEFLDKRGQEFLEEIDDWLTEHAVPGDQQDTNTARVGIGLFATEERISKEKSK